jgi:hypothetical protein
MVYLFLSKSTNLLKIGYSSDPKKRKKQIESELKEELFILHTLEGGFEIERFIHSLFKRFRVHSEWFTNSKIIVDYFLENQEVNLHKCAEDVKKRLTKKMSERTIILKVSQLKRFNIKSNCITELISNNFDPARWSMLMIKLAAENDFISKELASCINSINLDIGEIYTSKDLQLKLIKSAKNKKIMNISKTKAIYLLRSFFEFKVSRNKKGNLYEFCGKKSPS